MFRILMACGHSFLVLFCLMKYITSLKIGSLNLQGGAKTKCETTDIQNKIKSHHIFVIEESWLEKQDKCPQIPSYATFRTERKKHPKRGATLVGSLCT